MSHSLSPNRLNRQIARKKKPAKTLAPNVHHGQVDGFAAGEMQFPKMRFFISNQAQANNGRMTANASCLNKLIVDFRYQVTSTSEAKVVCSTLSWKTKPHLWVDDVQYHCMLISPAGAGSWAILLQVSGFIDWEVEFEDEDGNLVSQSHSIYFSMPVMYKDSMAHVALMAVAPWKLKLPYWMIKIGAAMKQIDEAIALLELATEKAAKKCMDAKFIQDSLKAKEKELNDLLRALSAGDGGNMA